MNIRIGKIVASHGLTGEVVVKHALGKKTDLENVKAIFIEDKNKTLLPWFIENAKAKNTAEIFIKLEGIDTREAARQLQQKNVWFTQEDFQAHTAKATPLQLLGYTAWNGDNLLGMIEEVIEQPQQLLCKITMQGKEVLLPLHTHTLKKIDEAAKAVHLQLPDGLLDIYLQ